MDRGRSQRQHRRERRLLEELLSSFLTWTDQLCGAAIRLA